MSFHARLRNETTGHVYIVIYDQEELLIFNVFSSYCISSIEIVFYKNSYHHVNVTNVLCVQPRECVLLCSTSKCFVIFIALESSFNVIIIALLCSLNSMLSIVHIAGARL